MLAGDQSPYFVLIPYVVLVCGAIRRLTGARITLICQLAIAVNGMVTAPLQFIADRRLTSARKTLDQVVPDAHSSQDTGVMS